jgi:hypothetical protein
LWWKTFSTRETETDEVGMERDLAKMGGNLIDHHTTILCGRDVALGGAQQGAQVSWVKCVLKIQSHHVSTHLENQSLLLRLTKLCSILLVFMKALEREVCVTHPVTSPVSYNSSNNIRPWRGNAVGVAITYSHLDYA